MFASSRNCLALLFVAVLTACAGSALQRQSLTDDWSWPEENPHLRLESLLDLEVSPGRWSVDAQQAVAAGAAIGRPHGVAWVGDDLIVTDPEAGRVLRIDAQDRVLHSQRNLLLNPLGVTQCSFGLVVSDPATGRLALLDSELVFTRWIAEDLQRPTGIACDGDELWVVETGAHRLTVLKPSGIRRHIGQRGGGEGEFNFPTAIRLDGDDVLVGDTLNFRVVRLQRSTGRFISSFGELGDNPGQTPRIKDLAVDVAGQVWVTDAHLDRVSLYTAQGRLLLSLGSRGRGPAEFSFPAGLAAHGDGRVAVVDSFNRRIQIFRVLVGESD